jgi:cobalt/nickel transport system permease protein
MISFPQLPIYMHIPDGFLSTPVAVSMYILTAMVLATAVRQTNRHLKESTAPLMGVLAAFIFAAQMMNFPIAGGTSGHLLGGALAAILVGPWAAVLIMATVIGVQGLVFQDGGLAALGANIFNMGIVTSVVGFGIFKLAVGMFRGSRASILAGTFAASWITVMLAALLTATQLAVSGTSPWSVVLPAMLGVHVFIGIGEGLIGVGAVAFVLAARPDLIQAARPAAPRSVSYSAQPGESA